MWYIQAENILVKSMTPHRWKSVGNDQLSHENTAARWQEGVHKVLSWLRDAEAVLHTALLSHTAMGSFLEIHLQSQTKQAYTYQKKQRKKENTSLSCMVACTVALSAAQSSILTCA